MSWETNELDTQYEDKLRTERQEEGTNRRVNLQVETDGKVSQ